MCGILGTINFKTIAYDDYKHFMFHRGPDAQLNLSVDNIDMYHYRLAIQDLSVSGNQPMVYKQFHIIFNGEIYNHLEVRKKYSLKCETNSDTETILKVFEILGEKMLKEFDGMFAMAIYDNKKKELFIARDRAGKKPLYYYKQDKKLIFSSELNTISKLVKLEYNKEALKDYFFIGSQFQEVTAFKNVNELRNGHYLRVKTDNLYIEEKKWWSIHSAYQQNSVFNLNEAKNEFNKLFDLAVKRRIESSDLEVGSFLSGGIDSGLVTAFASKHNTNLKTFTVAFKGTYNEAPLAKVVAEKFKTNHTEIAINFSNLKNDFEKIVKNYGEPYMDSSAIPSYYVSKEAKKHVTVILNGDGADELFGGYRRYVPYSKYDFFKTPKLAKNIARKIISILPVANNKQSKYNYLYRLIHLISKDGIHQYLAATADVFTGYEVYFKFKPNLKRLTEEYNYINYNLGSGLDKLMCLDFITFLFGDLLVKMDVATMANSLEGRSPFLSKELIEFGPSLNDNLKVRGKTTKYLLRQIAKETLPPQIFNQPKRGFEVPIKKWINEDLNSILKDYIYSTSTIFPDFVDKKFIYNLTENRINISDEKRAKMLYNILCLEIWNRDFKETKL